MIKKILTTIFCILFGTTAHSAQIVNVKYIHDTIKQHWDITIPYNPQLSNPQVAANMKYLLTTIDRANKILNGANTTNYGTGKYATNIAADTIATNSAIKKLIKQGHYSFSITTSEITNFKFNLSTSGTFYIDWGDGQTQEINKQDTNTESITHTYETTAPYTIKLGGTAAAYNTNEETAAISFTGNTSITGIYGSLGKIFPTLADGTQPRFYKTFRQCTNIATPIPGNLFAGIHGKPVSNMFAYTFFSADKISGQIPENLFSEISGQPATQTFAYTFNGCQSLTGPIPEKLFGKISGTPTEKLFYRTFTNSKNLTGKIPGKLFSGLHGDMAPSVFEETFSGCTGITSIHPDLFTTMHGKPADKMFMHTFSNCTGLTEIPNGLFASITGTPTQYMFAYTFYGCTGINKPIPGNLFAGLDGEPANNMFENTFNKCENIPSIPGDLFAGIHGAPAYAMFKNTFYSMKKLKSVPAGLFARIEGPTAQDMFNGTFALCENLETIPEKLFSGIYDAPQSRSFYQTFFKNYALKNIPTNLFGNLAIDPSKTPAGYSMKEMFAYCSNLTGESAKINGKYLYQIWPSATNTQVGDMYRDASGLSDYATIPTVWK